MSVNWNAHCMVWHHWVHFKSIRIHKLWRPYAKSSEFITLWLLSIHIIVIIDIEWRLSFPLPILKMKKKHRVSTIAILSSKIPKFQLYSFGHAEMWLQPIYNFMFRVWNLFNIYYRKFVRDLQQIDYPQLLNSRKYLHTNETRERKKKRPQMLLSNCHTNPSDLMLSKHCFVWICVALFLAIYKPSYAYVT